MNNSIHHSSEFITSVYSIDGFPKEKLPEIVFSGKSNVGKSSLLNSLLNKKIAKVSITPGRTQSINYFKIDNSFYFVDLPGYGYSKVPQELKKKWRSLIDNYLTKNSNIKLIIQLIDFRHLPSTEDMEMIEWLRHFFKNFIIVFTKTDKIGITKRPTQLKLLLKKINFDISDTLMISSTEKKGLEELWKKINE